MDYDWVEFTNSRFRFKTDVFSDNTFGKRFNRLNHEYMLISVASFGGPIAITSDKTKILTLREDDPSVDNICIFSNEGQIIQRIRLNNPFQNIPIVLEFIKDQFLLVVFQKGDLWIVNPHSAEIRRMNLQGLLEGEQVVKGKVFDNGIAIETSMRRFLFARTVFQPQLSEFASVEQQLKQAQFSKQSLFWRVFSPRSIISEKVQLHMVHPTAGIVQVVQNQGKRIFFNQEKGGHVAQSRLPHIRSIKYISNLSPNTKLIAYFAAEPLFKENPTDSIPQQKKKKGEKQPPPIPYAFAYRLIIAPSISSQSLQSNKFRPIQLPFVKQNTHINLDQQPLDIKWCGNKAIVIQFQNQELYMCSVMGEVQRIEKQRGDKDKWSYLKEEIDGTRILSKKDNKILREIPPAYVSTFQSFSQEPGALLRAAFLAFEDQQPLQDDQIRKDKDKLARAVEHCLACARYQLNFDRVIELMKAATYGKAFLPPTLVNNNDIYETSKILRICSIFRQKQRYITYQQLRLMGDDQLLKMLLRYQEHYLAFQIHQYLKKDQNFRVKIYTDWACCKVLNKEESEDEICQSIRNKLQNEKGVSFTEIAHRAIQIGRSQLAMKLLDFQPSLAKKVPLLLWIGNRENLENCHKFYQKSIQQALKSRDLNLLYLTIKRISASEKLSDYEIFELFSKNIESIYALINYYRMFSVDKLIKYYEYLQLSQTKIMELITMALTSKKFEVMQKFLFSVNQYLQQFQSNLQIQWRKETFRKNFQNLNQFITSNPSIKFVTQKNKPLTLGKALQVFMAKGDGSAVQDFKRSYKVEDKRVILVRIKVLIEAKKFEQLDIFMDKRQKDFKIPPELIADLLFRKGQVTWAMKMIAKMSSKKSDQQYLLLQRIGRYKEAIDLAFDRKDADTLEDIGATLLDATLIGYCNEKLNLLRTKR